MKEVNLETDQSVLYKLGSKNRIKNGMYNHQQFDTTVDKSDSYRCTKKKTIFQLEVPHYATCPILNVTKAHRISCIHLED